MAARSVSVTFKNDTDITLTSAGYYLSHGEWTSEPPASIAPGATVTWESESNGVLTGTEGEASYDLLTIDGSSRASFHWDNPYIGSNSYDESAPETFLASRSGGDGDNASVSWVLDDASSSGDGIPNDWKQNGVTMDPGDGSGPQFIDLPAMGADINKPDIFVQLDHMATGGHSHALSAAAIKLVVDAFANSPYVSKTGSIGINLHVDAGPASIMNFATSQTWGSLSRARQLQEVPQLGTAVVDSASNITSYNWTEFDEIKNAPNGFTSTGRTKIFRYCISAHQLATGTNSGVARDTPCSDFILSLGTLGSPTDLAMAGTFMHELGHCLGLRHGGGDDVNNKPNYVSVMNYLWQTSGVTRGGVAGIIDYSNAALNTVNENALDETVGLGSAAVGVSTKHWVPAIGGALARFVNVADGSQPIDWNGDGLATNSNISFDTNNDGSKGMLAPYNDWKSLKLRGGAIGAGGTYIPPTTSSIVEITPAQQKLILPADTKPPVTKAVVFPSPNAAGWNRTEVTVTFSATDDISGVARTECIVDGANPVSVTAGSLTLGGEGVHHLDYKSKDRSQNVEASKQLIVQIDKTAPEAVISFDPYANEIKVNGVDSLSGVSSNPASLLYANPTTWTDFGSDVAEMRVYQIVDVAGNKTKLTMKVRCCPETFEASVLSIEYDDVRHPSINGGSARERGDSNRLEYRNRNTIVFQRLVSRNKAHDLLGVKQIVSIGEGGSRRTIRARYDVLDDLTLLSRETGSACCSERKERAESTSVELDIRGLVFLRIFTQNGHLSVQE